MQIFKKSVDQSFILNLKPEEIKEIKNDILLQREGYQFYYAIDTYDILNHYLPYTEYNILNDANKYLVAQRAIAYEKFFSSFQNGKLVVLDEYSRTSTIWLFYFR